MCCAFALRFFYFEAQPAVAQVSEPLTQILVAKRVIPSGVEITADSVVFQEVAVSEVPPGSLTSFAQVYRRLPAYPIPDGCPICEDLLHAPTVTAAQAAFLPLGSQFITLDVLHVRQGEKVFSTKETFATVLAADQNIDIRVVPRNDVQGKLADKKNEVLRAYASQDFKDRDSGELLLENVPIHQVQGQSHAGPSGLLKILLVLDKSEATKLTAAAKKGQLQIHVHQESEETAPQAIEIADVPDVPDVADSPEQPLLVSLPFEPLPIEVPTVSELMSHVSTEPDQEPVPLETVQKVLPEPKTAEIFDSVLPPAPLPDFPLPLLQANGISQNRDQESDSHAESYAAPDLVIQEKIRNDSPKIAFGPPTMRVVSEPTSVLPPSSSMNEPERESSSLGDSETVTTIPRTLQSLPFHSPGRVMSIRELQKDSSKQTVMPLDIPSLMSAPINIPGRMPGYSPFERRTYNVLRSEELSEALDELPTPPRLLQSFDSETQIR